MKTYTLIKNRSAYSITKNEFSKEYVLTIKNGPLAGSSIFMWESTFQTISKTQLPHIKSIRITRFVWFLFLTTGIYVFPHLDIYSIWLNIGGLTAWALINFLYLPYIISKQNTYIFKDIDRSVEELKK